MPDPTLLCHVVTDLHHGPDRVRKLGTQATRVLDAMLDDAQAAASPLVVDLGDHLNDVDAGTDARHVAELGARYRRAPGARHHLFGDHDLIHLSSAAFAEAVGGPTGHAVHDAGPCRIVLFAPEVRYPLDWATHGYLCADEDVGWLERTLAASADPTIVLSHLPLVALSMAGNPYFEEHPWLGQYRNVAALTAVVRAAGNVVACLAGDTHQSYHLEVDAIHFVGLPSATESLPVDGRPSGAWTRIAWTPAALELSTFGLRPHHRALPLGVEGGAATRTA